VGEGCRRRYLVDDSNGLRRRRRRRKRESIRYSESSSSGLPNTRAGTRLITKSDAPSITATDRPYGLPANGGF